MERRGIDLEARAEYTSNKRNDVSGHTYVSAVLRENMHRTPLRDHRVRIAVAPQSQCDHGLAICSKWECVESWSVDYRLFLNRTVAGRRIADELRISHYEAFDREGITILNHADHVVPQYDD